MDGIQRILEGHGLQLDGSKTVEIHPVGNLFSKPLVISVQPTAILAGQYTTSTYDIDYDPIIEFVKEETFWKVQSIYKWHHGLKVVGKDISDNEAQEYAQDWVQDLLERQYYSPEQGQVRMGTHIIGNTPEIDLSLRYVAIIPILISIQAIVSIIIIVKCLNSWIVNKLINRFIIFVQIFYLVWEGLQIYYVFFDSPSIIEWSSSFAGCIAILLLVIGQMQILKAFRVLFSYLTVQIINWMQIVAVILFVLCYGGFIINISSYLGYELPVGLWSAMGYTVYALSAQIYFTWQKIFILYKLYFHWINNCSISSYSSSHIKGLGELVFFTIYCIAFDWISTIMWVYSYLKVDQGDKYWFMQIIASTLAAHEMQLTAFYFRLTQEMRLVNEDAIKVSSILELEMESYPKSSRIDSKLYPIHE
ncbi:hypothetical protein HDV06_005570 [Boothiomyces sp. JEL0866]|nr:hypothetical protein HDV06_005570 [Boothiomyces sp. JEL0866]